MSWMKWLYKLATGRTLGKSKELNLRYEAAQEQQTHADNTVQRTCVSRAHAKKEHDIAVSAQSVAIRERKARMPSADFKIHTI